MSLFYKPAAAIKKAFRTRNERVKRFLQISIAIVIVSAGLYPQKDDIKFEHLYEGLSQKSVLCISQDSKGFMWFGTV